MPAFAYRIQNATLSDPHDGGPSRAPIVRPKRQIIEPKRLEYHCIHICNEFMYIFKIYILILDHNCYDDTYIIDFTATIIFLWVEFSDLNGERTISLGVHTGSFSLGNKFDRQQCLQGILRGSL